jgi:hypothetical protein
MTKPLIHYASELSCPVATRYDLDLIINHTEGFANRTYITTNNVDNYDLASYISNLKIRETEELINDLNSLNAFNKPIHELSYEGSYNELVIITSLPAMATFNTGSKDLTIPLEDFLSILEEWLNFLISTERKD